ncbi:MAG: hypothetical protein KY466_10735 [Gemmatimonadetes bacterium]|nr:hypothetical protein [Gemmatimonadota bacterium]
MDARRGSIIKAVALLSLLAAPVACASTSEGEEGNTVVVVRNDLVPSESLSIYALSDVGSRRLVGFVDPRETATLRFNAVATGRYRFVAEATSGAEIVSNPITFTPGATIHWDVHANIATVTESG